MEMLGEGNFEELRLKKGRLSYRYGNNHQYDYLFCNECNPWWAI